jgi:hypothetical protein
VQQGFLADANALRRAATVSQPPAPKAPAGGKPAAAAAPGAPGTSDEKKSGEQDMLAQFLLDNLQ